MSKIIKSLGGCLITIIITIICICNLGYIVRPIDADGAFAQIDTFHNLPENSIDVIVYGSSHAFRGFNVMELYDKYGIGGYNYGFHWQQLNTTKMFLKDSLLTQNPKIVIIETYYAANVVNKSDMSAQVYYTRYLNNKEDRADYLKMCFEGKPRGYISYFFPLYAFHDNWSSLKESSFSELQYGSNKMLYSMGVNTWDNGITKEEIPDRSTQEQLAFDELALAELDEIVSICKENNIDIIFFTNPYVGVYQYSEAMHEYANKNGCQYFNMFELISEVGINEETDFNDAGHLNVAGATKVADYIGAYIDKNYVLADQREIEGNLWEGKTVVY